ncbi:hypothetical protein D1AOALGA4SA_12398 [Olavius algarvensis Delta 1 endosymbiont]|nr:hypothetical protein D1AOALGA4SA_12398 [Olavius algarvensis Delta 1 endosymbiont]
MHITRLKDFQDPNPGPQNPAGYSRLKTAPTIYERPVY